MYAGSCLCKKIRYEISQKLGDFGYCHCVSCRKASGSSPFTQQAKEHRYVSEKAPWEAIEDHLPQYAGPRMP